MIRLSRCPRTVLRDRKVARIVPYFYRWKLTNGMEYPDGNGLLFQPKKLVNSFELLLAVYNREYGK